MEDRQLVREKIAQATDILDEMGVDVWLTFVRETSLAPDPVLALILGMDVTWQSAFLLSRSSRHTAIVGFYDADNVRQLDAYETVIGYHKSMGEHLRLALDELQPRQIAINYSQTDVAADGLSHGMYLTLRQLLQDTPHLERLAPAEGVNAALRGRKSATEIARVRQAIATTQQLFDEVEQVVRPGMTQRQIAAFVQQRIEEMGLGYAWDKPYNPIVTCGPGSAIGHAMPGDVVLEQGHTLHLDLGVRQNEYCSDLQRTWYALDEGETEAPPPVRRAFDVVRGAIEAGRAALRPGAPGWQVDAAARAYVLDHGYAEFMHAFGHLLGRSAHDGATVLGPRWERYEGICELPVEVDNIFTLELHVVVPERGLVSLEEEVLVTADGAEYLSEPQTELRLIGR